MSESPPIGWDKEPNEVPYKLAALRGDLPLSKGQSSLDFYRAIFPLSSKAVDAISLKAQLPEDGQLEVWLTAPPRKVRSGNRWIDPCQQDPQSPRCGGKAKYGVGVRIDRIGTAEINAIHANAQSERILNCDGQPSPIGEAPFDLMLRRTQQGFSYSIDGQTVNCRTQVGDRAPQLRPGLREVHISQLSLDDAHPTPSTPHRFSAYAMASLFLSIVFGSLKGLKMPLRYWPLLSTPLFLAPILSVLDWKSWVETMRAAWLPYQWMPVILSGGLFLLIAQFVAVFRLSRGPYIPKSSMMASISFLIQLPLIWSISSVHSTVWLLIVAIGGAIHLYEQKTQRTQNGLLIVGLWALFGSIAALILGVNSRHALGAAALIGASFSALAWLQAKAQDLKGYNPLSLLMVGMMVFAMEGFLSGTAAGQQWSAAGARTEKNDLFGWVNTANEGFDLLTKGEHTDYPDKGYPVAFSQEKASSTTRVVSFGGSTTGGAFQNDDLNQFYPAKLGQLLGSNYQSINQGVGGWTSFHIARYIEQKASELRPDIAIFYIGHNDLLTASPLPYRDLYARWESNPNQKQLSERFDRFHLYHALRHILVSLRPAAQRAAVPVDHAAHNLDLINTALRPFQSEMILVSEGLAPDPGPLADYNTLLQKYADQHEHVQYLDAATRFHDYPAAQVFLDDCHLSDYGHERLAEWIAERITKGRSHAPNP